VPLTLFQRDRIFGRDSRTVTMSGIDANGHKFSSSEVYEKQWRPTCWGKLPPHTVNREKSSAVLRWLPRISRSNSWRGTSATFLPPLRGRMGHARSKTMWNVGAVFSRPQNLQERYSQGRLLWIHPPGAWDSARSALSKQRTL